MRKQWYELGRILGFLLVLGLFTACAVNVNGFGDDDHDAWADELGNMPVVERIEKSFENTRPNANLRVDNVNGFIRVEVWEKDTALVQAKLRSRKGKAETDKVRVEMEFDGNLAVKTRYLKKRADVRVDYTIRIPQAMRIHDLDSVNGAIVVQGRAVVGRIETTNGSIDIRGALAAQNLETVNGSIRAEIVELTDDARIKTVNGGIDLYLPRDINADFNAKTVNGTIRTNQYPLMADQLDRYRLRGQIGDGGGATLDIETVNGSIDLFPYQP
jgi:DUF4097 and DUF4098 domain-containing protein YvlB